MAIYTVHLGPAATSPAEADFVREGFNWWAFLLGPLWMLWRGLWVWAIAYAAATAAVAPVGGALGLHPASLILMRLALALAAGFWGNDLLRGALTRRGRPMGGIVQASDRESAERRFFDMRARVAEAA